MFDLSRFTATEINDLSGKRCKLDAAGWLTHGEFEENCPSSVPCGALALTMARPGKTVL